MTLYRPDIDGKGQALAGDRTTTGALLISYITPWGSCDGRGFVLRGDKTTDCPKCGKSGVIVEGAEGYSWEGIPIAVDRCIVSCDCPDGSNRIIAPLGPLSSSSEGSNNTKSLPIPAIAPFVAQICLTCPSGNTLKGLKYVVHLADGTTREGTTDQHGRIARITTKEATRIIRLVLLPPEPSESPCCIAKGVDELLVIDLTADSLSTDNSPNGAATKTILLPEGEKRALKPGEIAMARIVFKDSIDYSQVKVHHGGWWLFLGRQNTAVTPNGEMYYPKITGLYKDDFSNTSNDRDKALFMHEMVHVWQYQMGYWIKWHSLWVTSRGPSAYEYELKHGGKLSSYNMEQQGDIISDYFIICIVKKPKFVWNPQNESKDPALLQSTMQDFLDNPKEESNLPE